ncbi:hypothetical protein B0T14DRAFT_438063 [Immersiella caudata]|uniref:Uncharacterized protein n=1 Tax=Immersiella caudata TaxID=314043 RepID=A0AA39WDC9_9PEZI|nr:hypothetical protein B0T14DRAFT_438063 [Immersiella caudata]
MDIEFEDLTIHDRKIIVGIDFGTTFSGVAWAETQRADRRSAITSWPVSKTILAGETSEKVPTRLWYNGKKAEWGFTIPPSAPAEEIIEWFKLELDDSLGSMQSQIRSVGARGGRKVETLVTDYISALGEHLMYTLKQKLGEPVVKSVDIEFVVTVPAIWSDLAKERTRLACRVAKSLPKSNAPIHMISEPEAAAIYALHGLDPHGLKVNDCFLVCDAGGGTVDLIAYTITKLKPVLEVEEATAGTGGLCGSSFLNRRFVSFLKNRIGHLDGFDDELLAEAVDKFEKTVKRQFTANARPNDSFAIPVGGLQDKPELGIRRGRFALKASDLHAIFEPVVQEVIQLVKQQISDCKIPIRGVLMVGGFGASNYLKERLRNAIDKKIIVLQPPNAWLAVVHGAVMKGLALSAPAQLTTVRVQNRKARKHYGMQWDTTYSDDIHRPYSASAYYCKMDGCRKISVMNWFIKRGDDVSENKPYLTSFVWHIPASQGRFGKMSLNIYADNNNRQAVVKRDERVATLCRLEADLSHIPESELIHHQGADGLMYLKVRCEIESVYMSAYTQYTLIHKNQRYNTVTAEYV